MIIDVMLAIDPSFQVASCDGSSKTRVGILGVDADDALQARSRGDSTQQDCRRRYA